MILFKFDGIAQAYNLEIDCKFNTQANSLEAAVRNISYQAKKKMNLSDTVVVRLYGKMIIDYKVIQELVYIDDRKFDYELELDNLQQKKNKYVYENELLSREEVIFKMYNSVYYDNSKNRTQVRITNSDTIEQDGRIYIYDEENGVYWLDGIPFSEYILRKDV